MNPLSRPWDDPRIAAGMKAQLARRRTLRWRRADLDFGAAAEFDWDSALVLADTRQDYGEQRFIALA